VNLLRVQALEFEMQLVLNGGIYNMAHQWLLAPEGATLTNTWRVFDYPSKTWHEVSVMPISLLPNVLHTFVADHSVDRSRKRCITIRSRLTGFRIQSRLPSR